MELLIQNQNTIIALGVMIGIIIIGLILVPYLKKKGIIKQEDIENTEKAFLLASVLINVLEFDQKDKISSIFRIVQTVFEYISDSMTDADKADIAYKTTIKILQDMNIEITPELQEVVGLAINTTLGGIE